MYQSKKFPTVNEIKGLINLIITMKETYKFVHPLDLRDPNLITKKQFFTIEQARADLLKKLNETRTDIMQSIQNDITQDLYEQMKR